MGTRRVSEDEAITALLAYMLTSILLRKQRRNRTADERKWTRMKTEFAFASINVHSRLKNTSQRDRKTYSSKRVTP